MGVNPTTNRIYVANINANTVSVIDGATNTVIGSPIAVGSTPFNVAVNASTNRIYVANRTSNTVSVIDGATSTVVATITGFASPRGIAVDAANNRVYVTNEGANTVSVIDGSTNTVTGSPITVGTGPTTIALNAATNRAYTSNESGNNVSVINTATNTVVATVTVGTGPTGVAVDSANNRVYVTNFRSATVSVIDGTNNTVTGSIPVGTNPNGIEYNPTTARVYVANQGSNNVSVISTATNTVVDTVIVGSSPRRLGINPSTNRISVSNISSNSVSVILDDPTQSGASLIVNSLADTDDGTCSTSNCTLREAVNLANSTATTTAQTITFSVTGTIRLQSTLPTILTASTSGPLTITGPSGGIVISGDVNDNGQDGGDVRLFSVNGGANLSLNNLTLSGGRGNGGGAIINGGALSLTNSTLSGNTDTDFGGAIFNFGALSLTNSTLSGNTATNYGGGIFNDGTLTITNSTLSGNTATNSGGGAIFNNGGSLTLNNSLVAGNTAPSDPNINGSFTGANNITSGTAAQAGLETSDGVNAVLLKSTNGGPTATIALTTGGTAVNAGSNALIPADTSDADGDGDKAEPAPFDQRGTGFARIIGGTVDIGAYESSFTNQAPINSVPASQTMSEDVPLILSSATSNLISIADADAGSANLTVYLRPRNGRISFNTQAATNPSDLSGVSVSGLVVKKLIGSQSALNLALRNMTFIPIENYNGAASLTITTNDGGNTGTGGTLQDVDTVDIAISAVNDAPLARPDVYQIQQGSTLSVAAPGVLSNDSDVEGQALTVVLVADVPSSAGTLSLNSNGGFSFVPTANFSGNTSFTYRARDAGSADSGVTTVSINVTPTTPVVTDVSSQVSILRSGSSISPDGTQAAQTLVLTNTGTDISGPMILVVSGLTSGVTLANPSGTTSASNGSNPYVVVSPSGLASGTSINVTLLFDNPNNVRMLYSTSVFSGGAP